MCGGDIQAMDGAVYGTCGSCGVQSTLPKASDDNDRKANLFNRANHYRRQNEFDKAVQAYENILNDDNTDAEAHWGVVLSRYGIEYVDDPATGTKIPTCRRVQSESILNDADYLETLKHAPDEYTRSLYQDEAQKISGIQKGILAISSKEQPYDVFICYKESTDGGSRTKDSTIAQDIYYQLAKEGYRVFFSKITLENKPGQQYEPYIFSALNSARVMLAICTNKDYIESTWVKNEWSRFHALTKKDTSRLLIPCYRDIDPYDDLPSELSALQGYDMAKVGFMHDLTHTVKKILGTSKTTEKTSGASSAATTAAAPGVESLMKRGWLFLEDADWKQADDYFDRVLDIDPEHAPAYIGKLCAEMTVQREEDLPNNRKGKSSDVYDLAIAGNMIEAIRLYRQKTNAGLKEAKDYIEALLTNSNNTKPEPLTNYNNYKKAIRFSNPETQARLKGYDEKIRERLQQLAIERRYERLLQAKSKASTEETYKKLAQQFRDPDMNGYRDSVVLADECEGLALELHYYQLLQAKNRAFNSEKDYKKLFQQFRDMNGYRDTAEIASDCENRHRMLKEAREGLEKKEQEDRHKAQEVLRRIEQSKLWADQGLCRHCGGTLSFWGKKCKSCGR